MKKYYFYSHLKDEKIATENLRNFPKQVRNSARIQIQALEYTLHLLRVVVSQIYP